MLRTRSLLHYPSTILRGLRLHESTCSRGSPFDGLVACRKQGGRRIEGHPCLRHLCTISDQSTWTWSTIDVLDGRTTYLLSPLSSCKVWMMVATNERRIWGDPGTAVPSFRFSSTTCIPRGPTVSSYLRRSFSTRVSLLRLESITLGIRRVDLRRSDFPRIDVVGCSIRVFLLEGSFSMGFQSTSLLPFGFTTTEQRQTCTVASAGSSRRRIHHPAASERFDVARARAKEGSGHGDDAGGPQRGGTSDLDGKEPRGKESISKRCAHLRSIRAGTAAVRTGACTRVRAK